MNFSDETLMAYADGELDPQTMAALEAAMRTDSELAERVARQRALRGRVRAAFDPVLTEAVPERLSALVRAGSAPRAGNVVTLRPRASAPRWSWPQWGAMAASFILGALLVIPLMHSTLLGPVRLRNGHLVASGELASALSQQLASTQGSAPRVEIGVSFRSHAAQYCRSFTLHGTAALAGLACREGEDWRLQVLAPVTQAATGEYRQAASAPATVLTAIDAAIEGEAFDAAAERAARDRAWK